MGWTDHVALTRESNVHTGFWWNILRKRDYLVDPDVNERIIFRWIFRKWDGVRDWVDLTQDTNRETCKRYNEPFGSIKCGEFLD
jgi:hypothetical protein